MPHWIRRRVPADDPDHRIKPAGMPTLFACGPNEALQCWTDLVASIDALKRSSRQAGRRLDADYPVVPGYTDPLSFIDWDTFLSAPIYFWSRETAALVTAASASYPLNDDDALRLEDLPHDGTPWHAHRALPSYLPRLTSALCVFEMPTLIMQVDHEIEPLSALAWVVAVNEQTRELTLFIRGLIWSTNCTVPVWQSDGGISEGTIKGIGGQTFPAERLAFTRWCCAAAMFIEQELLQPHAQTVERAFRKRAVAAGRAPEEALCHVVRLRRATVQASAIDRIGHEPVEWSCRWLVRGHWRKQYFPSRGTNVPVWIHPHIKGPEDKPMRTPKPTVFAVVR